MPFGLTNAPVTFQSLMNYVFQPFLYKFMLIFFDDILIYSSSWVEHLKHVEDVLRVLDQHKLYVKLSKCSFGQLKIDYLGHIVSSAGVEVDQTKVMKIQNWPIPLNVKQLRGFLGLTGYYRRFIKKYAQIVAPLTKLLQKDVFQWGEDAQVAFKTLKQALTQAPVLALPNFTQPFILETDASVWA
ncbi:uncharacterized mitochondrial protein AtMg00860-like [Prosopis cineraria]|uniref:uncharacterized mitochondrial protein AtMg00860-like n=1 Tax=Prosopis cineraria TaxID=364024 RepID=UPI00240ED75B|nr:uncharacterized mitochondrial protein AtMg00860-like [Prosopis cineraria]